MIKFQRVFRHPDSDGASGNIPSDTFSWKEITKFQRAFQTTGSASGNVPSCRFVSLDGDNEVPEGILDDGSEFR